MSKIQALSVANFKRLRAVEITPGEHQIVILGGKNAQGKTSILDAIGSTLFGAGVIPEQPIRQGEDRAEVTVTLDDGITIRRTFTRKEDGTIGGGLTIRTADGMSPKGAQTWLNERLGALTCDPIAFVAKKPAEQADEIRRVTGIDTSKIDAEKARIYAERTDLGRDGKVAAGALASMPHHPDAPAEEVATLATPLPVDVEPVIVSAAAVSAELERARETQRKAARAAQESAEAHACLQHKTLAARQAAEALEAAKRTLAAAQAEEEDAALAAGHATSAAASAAAAAIDPAPIAEKLAAVERTNAEAMAEARRINAEARSKVEQANAESRAEADATNRKVRANAARAAKEAEVAKLRDDYAAKTAALAELDSKRAALIAAAKMPVDGLSIDEHGGLTFKGVPFSQASRAEQIRVSMAVAVSGAGQDGIRIALIRDASLLDEDSMALVEQTARDLGVQVWLERVGDRDEGAIVIEDGGVR
jgi:hypothetical protein